MRDSQSVARVGGLDFKQVEILWKKHVCQVRGRISQLDVGLSPQTIFFQIYRVVSGRIGSFGCRFWVDPEVLKIEMWETLKKVEKSTHCARTVCCCVNFEHFDFFLNVVHVYQLAGHLVGGDNPYLTERKIGVDMGKCANLGWKYEPKVAPVDLELKSKLTSI